MRSTRVLPIVLTLLAASASAEPGKDSPQFRGPDRGGIFAAEGLMKSWPPAGPPMLWSVDGLGEGYASVTIADGRIYTTGKHGDQGSVFAFDLAGKKIWSKVYGAEHAGNGFPGTRTTPSYADGRLFLLSSMGHAVALDAKTGDELWRVDLFKTFGGENLYFGISESPLIDGDRVIFSPGGPKASIVALNAKDGSTVWKSEDLSDAAAYCNPRLFTWGGKKQIVTLLAKSLVSVDAATGKLLWRQDYPATYDIHAVSPVAIDDLLYVSDGYDQGGKAFRVAKDGLSSQLAWSEPQLDVHHGGSVAVGGYFYGAASKKNWYALEAQTGKIAATLNKAGKGSLVYADGRIYGYTEDGKVLLVDPDPANFSIISSFDITLGEGHHWAHPVIVDGRLYIRHGGHLMAFDLKAR
jgi:outer membrane protein assembly factor BamB